MKKILKKLSFFLSAIAMALLTPGMVTAASQVSGNGIYTYEWTNNKAQRHDGNTYAGVISNAGYIRFIRNSVSDAYLTLGQIDVDDHNGPGFVINAARNEALVFYARHNQDAFLYMHRIDLTTFTEIESTTVAFPCATTYAQVISKGDSVVLSARSCSGTWRYTSSTDWGDSWSSASVLVDNLGYGNPYPIISQSETNTDLYHFAFGSNPSNDVWKDIVYGTLNIETGDIKHPNGTTVGNIYTGTGMPVYNSELSAVGPSLSSTQDVRFLDVSDKFGKPVIIYAKDDPGYVMRYYTAVYENGAWTRAYTGISSGGYFYGPTGSKYVGGVALGDVGVNKAYVSVKDGSTWKIKRYVLDTDFSFDSPATLETSTNPLVRPVATKGHTGIMYQELVSYSSFQSYNSYVWSIGW